MLTLCVAAPPAARGSPGVNAQRISDVVAQCATTFVMYRKSSENHVYNVVRLLYLRASPAHRHTLGDIGDPPSNVWP